MARTHSWSQKECDIIPHSRHVPAWKLMRLADDKRILERYLSKIVQNSLPTLLKLLQAFNCCDISVRAHVSVIMKLAGITYEYYELE